MGVLMHNLPSGRDFSVKPVGPNHTDVGRVTTSSSQGQHGLCHVQLKNACVYQGNEQGQLGCRHPQP